MSKLDEARKTISEVDKQIASLFEQRMEASKIVAAYKKEAGLPILDEGREKALIEKNSSYISNNEIKDYYVSFLQNTMDISKKYQERLINGMKVAYCGVEGAFAHVASKKMYPYAKLISYASFDEAYHSVEKGECDVAVLPVENSFAGDVGNVMDLIFSGSLYINQMLDLEIIQNLFGCVGSSKESIKKVISHPQALSQCNEYIIKNKLETEAYPNTAVAAKEVAERKDVTLGAIASKETAEIYDLKLIESNINTKRNNTTRFASFSKVANTPNANIINGQHFIIVYTVLNEAGALAKTLNIIGKYGFNMRNLRSRPMKDLLWTYYFFVELDGNINSDNGRAMLEELKSATDRLKLVGTYYSFAEK